MGLRRRLGGALVSEPQANADQKHRPQVMHAKYAQVVEQEEHPKSNQYDGADGNVVRRRWWRRLNLERRSSVACGVTGG